MLMHINNKIFKAKGKKRQTVYLYNIHLCVLHYIFNCGKAVNIKYFAYMSVAIIIHQAQR